MFQRRESDVVALPNPDLKMFEIFDRLTTDEKQAWQERFRPLEVAAGDFLYREGDPVTHLFTLEVGEVTLFQETVGRPVQLLERCGPGDVLGYVALLADKLHLESARAARDCRALRIEREDFGHLLMAHPELHQELEHVATERHAARLAASLELGKHREVRMRLSRRLPLRLAGGEVRTVTLENLSLGGFCVLGAGTSWRIGDSVSFELLLPEAPLPLTARVAWRSGETVGLAFEGTDPRHDTKIQMITHMLVDGAV